VPGQRSTLRRLGGLRPLIVAAFPEPHSLSCVFTMRGDADEISNLVHPSLRRLCERAGHRWQLARDARAAPNQIRLVAKFAESETGE
jgi:hypothetical protein